MRLGLGRGEALSAEGVAYGLLVALAATLAFEPVRPVVAGFGLELNHLKVLLGLGAVAGVVAWHGRPRTNAPLKDVQPLWASGLFLALATLSALLAPSHNGEALKFVLRLATGLVILLLVRRVVGDRRDRINTLLWAMCIGAGLSALLGVGEVAGWAALQPVLALFKFGPTRVGGDLRLSASFQYATIAAAFFELVAPLALVLAVTAARRWQWALAAGIACLCTVAAVLTLTRASLVSLVIAFAFLLAFAFARPAWRRLALPTGLAAASAGLSVLGLAQHLSDFDTRLATENDWGWYAASYAAPDSITLASDQRAQARVTVTNTGQVVWTTRGERPFELAYRWLSADAASQLSLSATAFDLPHDVPPGESVQLNVDVAAAVPPGDYRLAWGMLQENVLWFHDRGYPDAETAVHVAAGGKPGPHATAAQEPRADAPSSRPPVPRAELWRAALQMVHRSPLLGIGPDNFRHVYGEYLGLPAWDERVHANNLYLELLADVGVLGTLAFGLIVSPAVLGLARSLRARSAGVPVAGLSASLLAYFAHGTVDAFIDFTPLYLLFWLIIGLSLVASDLSRGVSSGDK